MNAQRKTATHPLIEKYTHEAIPKLREEFGIKNLLSVPKLTKITINIGLGEAVANKKVMDNVAEQVALITGQKPLITRAHRSIATFKIAAGDPIGVKVTLRGRRMYDFMQKLISVVLPRVRDFRGIEAKGFDGRGNYSLGFREQIVFPEIEYTKVDKTRGLQMTITTSAINNDQGKRLLELLGLPFTKQTSE